MDKLHSYQGWIGRFHEWREILRERYSSWRQENPQTIIELLQKQVHGEPSESYDADYSHIYRYSIFVNLYICCSFVDFS